MNAIHSLSSLSEKWGSFHTSGINEPDMAILTLDLALYKRHTKNVISRMTQHPGFISKKN
jgi:hypothetical protein